ncbi:sodium:proton antiporter [Synechococcus sp. PCC 7336]|uniref:cation:proton antiporter n=1 Tax=Synechococcus sp. PCC 7336 TaxID=195250 RepID=UPI00034D72FF|nr:sodium:proton antiporter [Synechococcus sp. PCC 7336]
MLPLFLAQAAPDVLESATEITVERGLERFLLVLTVSLSVATISRFSNWLRQVPYTLLLVIVGLCLAFLDVRLVDLSPELILLIFLPPLLFEAAWNLEWKALRQDWVPILLYAIFGVVISVLGIGLGLNRWAALPLPIALLIGASLSATDPVSVIALFRELGASKRLTVLMEGESLFNDGVAVVAFGLLVGIPLGQGEFTVASAISGFLVVVGVGVGLGAVVGFGISYLTQRFDLPMVEQSLTLVAAYGTYLLVEELGGSGVIGVVTVGIVLGNFGSRIGMNPRTRLVVTEFWDFVAFFVNSIVFLLIGDRISFSGLAENIVPIAVAIAAALASRAISTYGLGAISNGIAKSNIPLAEQTVLWWGGLRGSVSIALALSVPAVIPQQETIFAIVFGVVLFTLLVEGLTVKPLLDRLNLLGDGPLQSQYTENLARLVALNRVLDYLQAARNRQDIDTEVCRYQTSLVKGQIEAIEATLNTLRQEYPSLRELANERFKEELIAVEAETYAQLVRVGRLNVELSPVLEFESLEKSADPELA